MFPTLEEQLDLVHEGLATMKCYNNLALFKYHRKVMYDNLWNNYPALYECRGHVYDMNTGAIVQAAPRKCFNYLENDWWKDAPLDTIVRVEKKYNGFLANATIYNGKLFVTTTGSFDSAFQKLAHEMITKSIVENISGLISENFTTSFEICHHSDPHIVTEKEGAYVLGYRYKDNGQYVPYVTELYNYSMSLAEVLEYVKTLHDVEGLMLSGYAGQICKLKTPIYVAKKKLMRMTDIKIEQMYQNPTQAKNTLPSEFHFLVDIVRCFDKNKWTDLTEQDRRAILDVALLCRGYKIE